MKMTRGHFKVIASAINDLELSEPDKAHVVATFIRHLRQTNPAFSDSMFRLACEISPVMYDAR